MLSASVPPPGSVIAGKYRVERVLGAGGMAVVVEATHLILGQRVAIKLLRADVAGAQGVLERFCQEAQVAAQLPGEHIVRVTDVGQAEGGEAYIVMELLVGRDLEAELIARGALAVDEAVEIMLQACEGVAEAHAAGLIHRDLKPGNVFLTRRRDGSPHVKVLDFGISKLTRSEASLALTQTTANSFGTPLYMSPEQIQSSKHVDARSDQHALGAIFYTLLAAAPPYVAPSVTALSVVIATLPPPSVREVRPDVPPQLDEVIQRALAKKPDDRFRDLGELAQAIAPFGGPSAQAAVRRIAGTLAYARPPVIEQTGTFPGAVVQPIPGAPQPSPESGRGWNPPSAAPPSYGGASAYGIPAAYAAPPGYQPPPGYGSPLSARPVDLAGARAAQTSAALSSPVSGERSPPPTKAIMIVGASAISVAVIVALGLAFFGPRRAAQGSLSIEETAQSSELAPSAAPVVTAAPTTPTPVAPTASASEPETAPSAAPSPAPVPSPSVAKPATVSSPPPRGAAATPTSRTAASTKPTTTKKTGDPGKVFGARR